MAKKRKSKDEEDELDFKFPKFDEEKFLKKERRNIKTIFISFFFGLIMGAISFGFWALLKDNGAFRWPLVFLVGFAYIPFIRYFFIRLNIDLTDFGKKGWFMAIAIYFFAWLLVLMVLVNPPFYDDEVPNVEVVVLPGMQEIGGTVKIVANIADNVGVEKKDITFELAYPNGADHTPDFTYESNIFSYIYENTDNLTGEFSFKITAKDVNNHETIKEGVFKYDNDAIILTMPEDGSELRSYTPIEFKVNGDVYIPTPFVISGDTYYKDFRLYYTVNDNVEINVSRLDDENRENYRSTAEFEGWPIDTNVTLKAYVEVTYYFVNNNETYSNIIEDTETYNFKTLNEAGVGTKDRLVPPRPILPLKHEDQIDNCLNYYLPCEQVLLAPGFELVVFLASLVAVVLIFKYKKKDRCN